MKRVRRIAGRAWSVIVRCRNEAVVEQYIRAGARFGAACSYIYMGECVGFDKMRRRWALLEKKYAQIGYRTISLDDFIEYGGYGKAIDSLVRVQRAEGEDAVFHADIFELRYSGGFEPSIDLEKMSKDGEPQVGHYELPTTKPLPEEKEAGEKKGDQEQDPPASGS